VSKKFSELRKQMSPERQAKIAQETQRLLAETAEALPKGNPWQERAHRYERVLRDIAEALDPDLQGCDYDPAECAAKLFKELVAPLVRIRG
jgi:hypothetical protein